MRVLLDPIWAWPLVFLAAAGTLATVVTTYPRRIAHLALGQRRLLVGLRLAAWAILVFALLRPALEFTRTDPHAAVFPILMDASRSMGVKDASASMSRREALLKTFADCRKELELLGKDIQILPMDFDQELALVETPRDDPSGMQTAIGHVLDSLPRSVQGKRIAGALLLSDGANRAIAPFDVDPRAAAGRLAEQQIRVDTVVFGASGLTDTTLDLIAEDLVVSPTVFVKNRVEVGAKIRASGAADRELTVRLRVEDPATALPGKPPNMKDADRPQKLKPTRTQEVLPVQFSNFVPQEPGEYKLTLDVVPLDGEPLVANNSLTTYITVLKGGISVAYFDKQRVEQKFIRRMDESPDIRLDFKAVRLGQGGRNTTIEEDWFDAGKYDVYMIGSVPAHVFGAGQLQKLARNVVEGGAGLMMTGGVLSLGPGGYAESPLADLLPVRMHHTERQTDDAGSPDPGLHHVADLQMLPTSLGVQHFVMRLDSPDKNLARWRDLPKLAGANKFKGLKDGALTLAESSEKYPLLIAQDVGRGRTMAFAADTTYLWYLGGKHEDHQRFWQQTILWLAHKDQQGDEAVWLKLDARRFRVGQPVGMTFGARDAEKRPIDDAEFTVDVTGPAGRKQIVTPQRLGAERLAKFLETQQPGEYRVHIEATRGGKSVGLPAESRFIVYEQDLELHNPAADFALLDDIARITGGSTVRPEELAAHLRRLAQQGLNVGVTEVTRLPLWDNWPVLSLFVLALSAEWFVRKRRGLV